MHRARGRGSQNIFARIVRKQEPADIVWEDDMVVAFKDKHPASTVHLLIVPKYSAVRSPAYLTVQHVDLLEHMVSYGAILWSYIMDCRLLFMYHNVSEQPTVSF